MGLKPGDFWAMTPYETRIYVEAQRRERMAENWFTAKLSGAKVPPLEQWLDPQKSANPSMDAKAFFLTNFTAKFNNAPKMNGTEEMH
jgi:hypothetical protein